MLYCYSNPDTFKIGDILWYDTYEGPRLLCEVISINNFRYHYADNKYRDGFDIEIRFFSSDGTAMYVDPLNRLYDRKLIQD